MPVDFSVIVPAYNREDFIDETLAAIFAQKHPPAEVIVVDDGSTDATARRAAAWARCTVIRAANGGAAQARHSGVLASRHPWIAFCDSDDLWLPDHLGRIAATMALRPDIGFVFTNFVYFSDDQWKTSSKFDEAPAGFWDHFSIAADGLRVADVPVFQEILRFQPIFPSCTAMTRPYYDATGGYDPSFGKLPSEDLEFALRCVLRPPVAALDLATVGIRRHAGNHSGDLIKQLSGEVEILTHSRAAHGIGAADRRALDRSIADRTAQAIDGAFARRAWPLLGRLRRYLPWHRYSPRRAVKIAIGIAAGIFGRETRPG